MDFSYLCLNTRIRGLIFAGIKKTTTTTNIAFKSFSLNTIIMPSFKSKYDTGGKQLSTFTLRYWHLMWDFVVSLYNNKISEGDIALFTSLCLTAVVTLQIKTVLYILKFIWCIIQQNITPPWPATTLYCVHIVYTTKEHFEWGISFLLEKRSWNTLHRWITW